jgi:GNAT superfamily N-acetyltransferase
MRHAISDTLLLRTVESEADVQKIVDLCNIVFSDTDQPDPRVGAWAADLLAPNNHPTLTWNDYFLVENTASGEIVSTLNLIPQVWTYEGIPFGVGRIELVGTHKEYRRQGLVRAQFEAVHRRCEELGLPVQGITGIPYYYRQFGYEYALELAGGYHVALSMIPETPASSPFSLREWQPTDLPRLETLYASSIRGKLIACQRPASHWHYRFAGQQAQSALKHWLYVIVRANEIVGYLVIPADCEGPQQRVVEMVLDAPSSDVIPWLLPRLRDESAVRFPSAKPPHQSIYFNLGSRHPIYPFLRSYRPIRRRPYAWYIRVPDLAGFTRLIAPVLERRIAHGPLAGLTRSLVLNFYTGGLRLDFEAGRLAAADNLPPGVEKADASLPPLVFLQLVFGYRNFSQLYRIYPDAIGKPEVHPILNVLFPRKPSWLIELY